jgi:hypothetical protein
MKRYDLLEAYCKIIIKKGFSPGLITLNPILLDEILKNFQPEIQRKLIVCFNINLIGFNVFPSNNDVDLFISKGTLYLKMGMSILSSGGTSDIKKSLEFIKNLPLDYVVFGSSNIDNIKANYELLK